MLLRKNYRKVYMLYSYSQHSDSDKALEVDPNFTKVRVIHRYLSVHVNLFVTLG